MRYVIFGTGRVGRNIEAYVKHLGHDAVAVSHQMACEDKPGCRELMRDADIVAAAIPDGALPLWREEWAGAASDAALIHFSGAAVVGGLTGYHPLFSFPAHVIDMAVMENIPFARPPDAPPFSEVFPGAPNPGFVLQDKYRARYHALAVLSGNFAAYLWNRIAQPLQELSGLPPEEIMGVYVQSLVDRFLEAPSSSLTGPVARRDKETVKANLAALKEDDDLKALYEAFIKASWPDFPE